MQFLGNSLPLSGTERYQNVTGNNGSPALQASFTFVPPVNENISANYSGDSSYPAALGIGGNLTVVGNDFSLTIVSPSITVKAGQQQSNMIDINGQSNYVGPISFSGSSCSGLPNESTCSFSPASVTGTGWTEVTIATAGPHIIASSRQPSLGGFVLASFLAPLFGLFSIGSSRLSRARRTSMLGIILLV